MLSNTDVLQPIKILINEKVKPLIFKLVGQAVEQATPVEYNKSRTGSPCRLGG